jgi:hypothetical protein
MKTFLIIAERPKHVDEAGATEAWQAFLSETKPFLPPSRKGDELPEGVWQIPVESTMRTLGRLLPMVKEYNLVLRCLYGGFTKWTMLRNSG